MSQRRQPKGTETGGQFAPDANPESTVVLGLDPGVKERYVAAITAGYAGYASLTPNHDVSRYLPNDEGIKLIAESSIEITGELETRNGVAWTAVLRMGDKTIYVENSGDGGLNHYSSEGGRSEWQLIEELNDRVRAGFPGLSGGDEIDDFCSIIEMAHEGDPT